VKTTEISSAALAPPEVEVFLSPTRFEPTHSVSSLLGPSLIEEQAAYSNADELSFPRVPITEDRFLSPSQLPLIDDRGSCRKRKRSASPYPGTTFASSWNTLNCKAVSGRAQDAISKREVPYTLAQEASPQASIAPSPLAALSLQLPSLGTSYGVSSSTSSRTVSNCRKSFLNRRLNIEGLTAPLSHVLAKDLYQE